MEDFKDITPDFKKNPFEVPEGYFDKFPMKIQERVSIQESFSEDKRPFFFWRPQLTLAFVVVAFTFISYVGFNFFLNDETKSLNAVQISELIENDYINIDDDYLLYEMLSEENVDLQLSNIDDEDVLNYLDIENVDESVLYNE